MARQALIIDGEVREIFPAGAPEFHPDVAAKIRTVPAAVRVGWIDDAGTFKAPPAPVLQPAPKSAARKLADVLIAKGVLAPADAAGIDE